MDTELKVANQKGHGWEGQDMHATAEFLQEEEALAMGAEGALERQEARRKMIAAIEDEGIESLSQHTKVARGRGRKGGKEQECVMIAQIHMDYPSIFPHFFSRSPPPFPSGRPGMES